MKVYGLTGGVGMGKSTSAELLRQRGVAVVDTDLLARELVEPGQAALVEIAREFGPELIGADGRLLRAELARRVFSDETKRRRLEAILHPRIRERWLARTQEWKSAGVTLGVVVIPLLFETQAENAFHSIVCVACSAATQAQRLRERGWRPEECARRMAAQWPPERKMTLADFVVWTEAGLDVHAAQWDRVLAAG